MGTRVSSWPSSQYLPQSTTSRRNQRLQCIRPTMRWRGTNLWHQMTSRSTITILPAKIPPLPAGSEEPSQPRPERHSISKIIFNLKVDAGSGTQWARSPESSNSASKNPTYESKATQSPNTEMKMRLAVSSLLPPLPFSFHALLHYWNSSNLWIFGSFLCSS